MGKPDLPGHKETVGEEVKGCGREGQREGGNQKEVRRW